MGCRHFRWRQLSCCCADTEGANRVLCQPQLGDCFPPLPPPTVLSFLPSTPRSISFFKKTQLSYFTCFFSLTRGHPLRSKGDSGSVSLQDRWRKGPSSSTSSLHACRHHFVFVSSAFSFFQPPCSFCFVPAELYTLGLDLSSLF